jgi:hypothetical protein
MTSGRLFYLFVTLATAQAQPIAATQISATGLTRDQAQQILKIALKNRGYDFGKIGMSVESLRKPDGTDPHKGYYDFSLSYDTPASGATEVLGAYAVSSMTGDVWELNLCKRFSNPELREQQKVIIRETGTSFAAERAARLGLGCTSK